MCRDCIFAWRDNFETTFTGRCIKTTMSGIRRSGIRCYRVGAASQNIMQCMKQGIAKVVELYSLILWTSYSWLQCPRFVMKSCGCSHQRPIIGAATQNLVQWMKQSVAKVVVLYTLILWTSYSSFSALYRIARVHLYVLLLIRVIVLNIGPMPDRRRNACSNVWRMEPPWVEMLVVVVNMQMKTLNTEVMKG